MQQQRDQLSNGSQRYFLPLETIKQMIRQVQSAADAFKSYVLAMTPLGQAAGQQGQQGQQGPPGPPGPGPQGMPHAVPQRPQIPQNPHPPAVAHPAPSGSASSPIVVSAATPIQKRPTPKPIAETPSAPTPSASAATPAASAPTPTHAVSSPQTPKSPRNKPVTKAKQPPKPRRVSKVPPSASAGPSAASPAADAKPPATPATPASAPTPESTSSSKRQREDEPATPSTSVAAPPAAKKIKMEFDEPPNDVLAKRQAEADAVKTDEEAIKFFEQMSNWLNQVTSEDDGQDSLKTHIADHLDEILKAYPDMSDDSALSSLAGTSFLDGITIGSSSPRQSAVTVDPSDFFDFTSYGLPEEDSGSKAATPDLVQASSSVGPSPGSASETEAHPSASSSTDTAKIAEPKSESSEDTIPQELWRAFDGGESAFYNASDNWKWDQPMPAVEQPWAFYPS